MGVVTENSVSSVTVLKKERRVDQDENPLYYVEVMRSEPVVIETVQDFQFVEVFRSEPTPIETVRNEKIVERVYPVGTLVNVGVGPELPEHPYEGQVWIKV